MTRLIRVDLCDECPYAAGSRSTTNGITVDIGKIQEWLFSRAEMHQDRGEWDASFEDLYLATAIFRGDFTPDPGNKEIKEHKTRIERLQAILDNLLGEVNELEKEIANEEWELRALQLSPAKNVV